MKLEMHRAASPPNETKLAIRPLQDMDAIGIAVRRRSILGWGRLLSVGIRVLLRLYDPAGSCRARRGVEFPGAAWQWQLRQLARLDGRETRQ